jgi:hypothetical protein
MSCILGYCAAHPAPLLARPSPPLSSVKSSVLPTGREVAQPCRHTLAAPSSGAALDQRFVVRCRTDLGSICRRSSITGVSFSGILLTQACTSFTTLSTSINGYYIVVEQTGPNAGGYNLSVN